MRFEWDNDKNKSKINKHGIDFQTAIRIFEKKTLDKVDDRFDYSEKRIVSLGIIDNVAVIVVVHTDRDGIIRIISARKANKKERNYYEQRI